MPQQYVMAGSGVFPGGSALPAYGGRSLKASSLGADPGDPDTNRIIGGDRCGLLPMAALAPARSSWIESSEMGESSLYEEQTVEHVSSTGSFIDSISSFSLSDTGQGLLAQVFCEDRVLLILMLLLGPPVVGCTLLSINTSALYWIGDVGFSASGGALLWATVGQVIMHRRLLSRRTACVMAVVIPTAGLLAAAHVHRTSAAYFASRLHNKECGTSFPAKHQLQLAWLAAEKIHDQCVSARADLSGILTDKQVELVMPVSHCPGYEEGLAEWGSEWAYLEALEGSHHCAGWCEFSPRPLWRVFMVRKPHDRCSLAASGVLDGLVYRTASQVEIYCTSLLFFFILLSLL